ncbi:MAG: glycosyltransferase family 2 protein [Bdellovibrionales bacterium]
MEKLPVSLVVITLNEEHNIERCLRSAPWVSEMIVVDSGSTDKTAALAQALGAKVVVEPFRGFRAQKEFATSLAKNDWVLSLDADEALSPELSLKLQEFFKTQSSQFDGVETTRLSYHMGRWIHHGGWYPDWQLRFFNRKQAKWVGGHVHERVEGSRVKRLQEPLHHWVFKDLSDQVDTNNDYSSRGAKDLFDLEKRFSMMKLVFKPYSKFLETYFWKRGFLDGLPGFIIAVGAAYSVFLKYSKLWELEKSRKNP